MARTHAVYYRAADGSEPVDAFIASLPPRRQAGLDLQIDRLNGLPPDAPPLPYPHTSQVRDELRELRCHFGREHYRILYRRSENLFVLLHAFRKTTARVPDVEITIAQARWDDFSARMNAPKRTPPRAIGHDAP